MPMEERTMPELELPGFRFHPTEEELLNFYLKKIAMGKKLCLDIIGFLNIYLHDPWELPGLAKIGEREWYFFVPRDRRQGHGGRPSRTTKKGFWKATGSDRHIRCLSDPKNVLGLKKTLVFYQGRAPRGHKTDWIMNEYRLPDTSNRSPEPPKEDIVLCKIYRKATSLKLLEQRAAEEEQTRSIPKLASLSPQSEGTFSSNNSQENCGTHVAIYDVVLSAEEQQQNKVSSSSVKLSHGKEELKELEVPNFSMDFTGDQFWSQLISPLLDQWKFEPLC